MNEQTSVVVSPVAALEARVAEQEKRIAELQAALTATAARKTGERKAMLYGLSASALLRSLGVHGWTAEQMYKLCVARAATVKLMTCVNAASQGRMWAKRNPCALRGNCGPEPLALTEEQLRELAMLRDGEYALLSDKTA